MFDLLEKFLGRLNIIKYELFNHKFQIDLGTFTKKRHFYEMSDTSQGYAYLCY